MDPYVILDVVVFLAFVIAVITVGITKSRHEKDSEDYFLAGRGLTWWLIGFSLIAANISSEHFVGMSGQAARYVGLAIASYEWLAAITLVVVAFLFLPKFLRAGIYTIPEFLEYRFDHTARTLMSLLMMIVYILVTIPAVIYSGGLTIVVLFRDIDMWGDFQVNITNASWIIGVLAAIYVVAGGLKACAWADLLQGSALILGGAIVTFLAFQALGAADPQTIGLSADQAAGGAIERFRALNAGKLHMALPADDGILPWTALMLGLWIPNFYYWGLNQYICQRTLGANSLANGQRGVVFAAGLKLLIPFVIVLPGIVAVNLFAPELEQEAALENKPTLDSFTASQSAPASARRAFDFDQDFATLHPEMARQIVQFNRAVSGVEPSPESADDLVAENAAALDKIKQLNRERPADLIAIEPALVGYRYDSAFPLLMRHLVRPGIRGFILAALLGAVISSLAAMLNAASTIFTMDIYREYISPDASQSNLVTTGRSCVALFAVVGCLVAPLLGHPNFKGIFTYIQEFQGFLSPGVLAVFIFGLFVHRAPRVSGVVGLLISPIIYGLLYWFAPDIAFLNRMAITFGVEIVALSALTLIAPLSQPVTLPEQSKIALEGSSGAKFWGAIVILVTFALYWKFW